MSELFINGVSVMDIAPFSLRIAAGEIVCLSGASGSGKSMLLRAIADLIPHRGEVSLDEQVCSQMRPSIWRQRVGYMPADSQWWHDTVRAHFEHVDAALEAQAHELGFSPEVWDWQVSRLSSGEKQRLALLRRLANHPQALLLDEPTASLDPESVIRAEKLIADYQSQMAAPVLWVSHDTAQIARVATRVLQLANNEIQDVAA